MTVNQVFPIEVINLTQNRIIELAREALPSLEIEVIRVSTRERYERGVHRLSSGIFDSSFLEDIIFRFVFDPELQLTSDTESPNALLGVERLSEEQFKQLVIQLKRS
ncbi:hypothetical protein EsH8_IX_000862 [Colletotrichum jinshuiense]